MARDKIRDTHASLLNELAPGQDVSEIGAYAPSSSRPVKWQCALGHQWESKLVYRTQGSGCPVCANRVILVGFNDLATTHPDLAAEWHSTKNVLRPEDVVAGAGKKVWWECSAGHEWQTTVLSRSSGTGCRQCNALKPSPKKGIKGKVTVPLAVSYPNVAVQWVSAMADKSLTSQTVSAGSNKVALWQAVACGHTWEQSVARRVSSYRNGVVCGVCDGRLVQPGVNDLFAKHPHLLSEWDASANGGVAPRDMAETSSIVVWWQCSKGHRWDAPAVKRALGQGCAVCAGKRIVVGQNDLASVAPRLAAEWHPTKNGALTPQEVTEKNGTKVWWQCSKGHEWKVAVYARSNGNNCPVCGGKQVVAGFNDLATLMPSLAKEWHPTANGALTPKDVTLKSGITASWVCPVKGHAWRTSVATRANGSGCPRCLNRISKGEQEIINFVKGLQVGKVEESVRGVLPGKNELDVYVKEAQFAIEHNGIYFHSTRYLHASPQERHRAKYEIARDAGIFLIQVWEDEWRDRRTIVERSIARKLGVSEEVKVNARQADIAYPDKLKVEGFMVSNHIQGSNPSSSYVSLQTKGNNETVAMLGYRREAKGLHITRYATSANVRGGFTKLLSHVRRRHPGVPVFTFSDNCVSDGKLYSANGFVKDGEVPPDYHYVVGKRRVHKSNYRIARFKKDPALKFVEGLSEFELAALNGLHRIWDAGKVKWVLK